MNGDPRDWPDKKETPFEGVFSSRPVYQRVDYPVPWRKLLGLLGATAKTKAREEWRRRTWYGRLKIAILSPFLALFASLLAVMMVLWGPSVLIVPIVDAIVRLQEPMPDLPETHREEYR